MQKVKHFYITPIVKTDTFVNEDYKEATISNIGRYLESPDIEQFKKEAKKRLVMIKKYRTSLSNNWRKLECMEKKIIASKNGMKTD